ncbi:MAG: hypothetical protein KAQ83_04965, partial [Nanoarchaeota archaeon]|nr:hypothetical protein [Nanoarchaeota archaeon]
DIEVLFPNEVQSYPKRVIIATFELPPKIYGGKSYIVKSNIINEGDLKTKVLVELGSYNEFESMEITLEPGEIKTVDLNITFYSTGVSFLESKIYYLDGDHKYLINFFAKESVVTDEKIADLQFQDLELYLESNQEINQNDDVKLKINLFNKGKFPAFNAIGTLSSNIQGLTITKGIVDYGTISSKLISGGKTAEDYFEIQTKNTPVQENSFEFSIEYLDNQNRIRNYNIPVTIFEGDDKCLMNWDCKEGFFCNQEGDCQELICDCGEKTEHRCINPTDSKCPKDEKCSYYGTCEDVECECGDVIGHKCVLPDDNKCPDDKRCEVDGTKCLDIY